MDEFLRIKIKSEFEEEEEHNLAIPSVNAARNFDFTDPLYIGGIPSDVRSKFSEKIISKYGIQVERFSININFELFIKKYCLFPSIRKILFCYCKICSLCC